MKRLIVNADDFGYTRGVNAGIIRAFSAGIVTSTTIMANGQAFDGAVELARANPSLGVGCHLSVVGGRPVAEVSRIRTLVDGEGLLPATLTQLVMKLARGAIVTEDIEHEFSAQVERVTRAGINPTHLDTHKHSHSHPKVMRALARVAAEFGITRIRNPFEDSFTFRRFGSFSSWASLKQYALGLAVQPGAVQFKRLVRANGIKTPDRFLGVGLTGMLDSAAIRSMMESLVEGTTELMCHPGVYDDDLERAPTRLKRERERELEGLSDPSLQAVVEARGIRLISYGEL